MHVLASIKDGFHGPVTYVVIAIIAIIIVGIIARKLFRR
jgi:type IV secretory pathway VirB2 component (pilin)